jgi:UDP-N-acetylmuramoyl-tripeptide--D-alanyl-D-alanine ligase
MIRMRLSEAAEVLAARYSRADVSFHGLSTDSRRIETGNLFVALQGPNFDGHDYIEQARRQGAAAAAVTRQPDIPLPMLRVASTRLALGQLAAHWRTRFDLPVVAITGSNGKTTVKEMTAAILARMGNTLVTRGNLNNDIGLPLTLSRLSAEHQYAVVEMGANHPGEIAYLAGIARPTVAVVTNAGPAHLEGFGDLEGVAHGKGEVYTGLSAGDTAVINADDLYAPLWREKAKHCRVIEFGLTSKAQVRAEWEHAAAGSLVRLHTPCGSTEIHLPLPGRHNILNALAAAAAAHAAGADTETIRQGLNAMVPVHGRLTVRRRNDGVMVIDDTYNANPQSLQAALDVLAISQGEKWLVLGDMGELGAAARELHREAGCKARLAGVSRVFTLGDFARETAVGFGSGARSFDHMEELVVALVRELRGEVCVLVKGSRRMAMERAVDALQESPDTAAVHTGGGRS